MRIGQEDIPRLRADFEAMATVLDSEVISTELRVLSTALRRVVDIEESDGVGVTEDLLSLLPDLRSLVRSNGGRPRVVVSRAMLGIASTGGVALGERRHADRLLILLAFHHVVLLPANAILPSLPEVAPVLRRWERDQERRYVTFVSGPSRTSDIERVLTIGVHGPGRLTIVLVSGWNPSRD